MRISDWSSDVCSSDLPAVGEAGGDGPHAGAAGGQPDWGCAPFEGLEVEHGPLERPRQAREVDRAVAAPQVADDLEALLEAADGRSEEHTYELQSLMSISYAVLCLKKKQCGEQLTNITQFYE